MPRNLVSSPAWTPRQIVQRAWQVVHTEGLVSLWFKILGECGYRRVVLFVRQFEGQPAHVDTRLPVQLGRLQPDELDAYFALRPEADPDDIRHRLATGHICYTARSEGRLIHVCWITTGHAWIAYLDREIDLAPDDVYSYESFTAPEFRGSNIAAARSMYMQETLHAVGYRRAVAVVMPENRSAYGAVEKKPATDGLGCCAPSGSENGGGISGAWRPADRSTHLIGMEWRAICQTDRLISIRSWVI